MSSQFYSTSTTTVQNAMGGTHLHTPQSIFQPTMSHTGPQNESQWLSMPQVPAMTIPWSMPSFQQPDLVRFTGQEPLQSFNPFLHQKRKLETPDVVDTRPSKQFITEEKMAQHFRELYISPNNSPMATTQESVSSPPVASSSCDIEASSLLDIDENISQPRLVISDEIKRLQQEPILPTQLLSKLERPTMALVLWEPPSKLLPILAQRDLPIPSSSEDNNNRNVNHSNNNSTDNNNDNSSINNNNETIPNLNQTMDVNTIDPILEPMDL